MHVFIESAGEDEEEAASGGTGGCMKPSTLRGGSGGADIYLDMPRPDPPSSTTCLLIEKPDVVDKKVKVSTNIPYDIVIVNQTVQNTCGDICY
ncbi:hypothetical protein CBL_01182 [Carabus blaptoides fortunei]